MSESSLCDHGFVYGCPTCTARYPLNKAQPAPFEAFRKYLDDAVAQLTKEMAEQQVAYAVPPTDDITALMRACAKAEGRTVWQTWRSWALRHLVPVQWVIDRSAGELTDADLQVLNKRLRDLLGYVVLGLTLCERRMQDRP